jgi:hypothetical protein
MKIGKRVFVCHDGKWGRRVVGTVTATRNGHHIKVKFPHPNKEGEPDVEFWARVIPKNRWNVKHFGGWAECDCWCPWFSVYSYSKSQEVNHD